MHWDLRVVSVPSNDSELAILVTFDHVKYLFNCGEGTQRSFVQKRLSMKKLGGVFFTSGDVGVVAGLPGLIMSAADAGVQKLCIGGPREIAQHLVSCRTFLQRDNIEVKMLDVPSDAGTPMYSEPHIKITAISLRGSGRINATSCDTILDNADEVAQATRGIQGIDSAVQAASPAADLLDTGVRMESMSAEQLNAWRKIVIGDILRGPASISASETPQATPEDDDPAASAAGLGKRHPRANPDGRPSPSRLRMAEILPLYGHDERASGIVPRDERVAYILQAPLVRGKFDAAKAKALQIPNGPLRAKLAAGQTVEYQVTGSQGTENRVVKPEDVLGASQDGGACIIIDATLDHLPELLGSAQLQKYRVADGYPEPRQLAHTVVHRIPGSTLKSLEYRQWMASFGPSTHHMIADPEGYTDAVSYTSSAWNLLKMSLLDEAVFPPVATGNPAEQDASDEGEDPGASVRTAASDLEVRLMPPGPYKFRPSTKELPQYPTSAGGLELARQNLAGDMPAYIALVKQAKENWGNLVAKVESEHFGIQVTPLGTGSAMPSKYRNVSSTLLEIPNFGNVLLDAGEGTLGQLRRRFGMAGLRAVYAQLRIIFISHMHADHHMGLRALLLDRAKMAPAQRLYIIAPSYILLYLGDNGVDIGDTAGNVRFIDSHHSASLARRLSTDVSFYREQWSSHDGMVFRHEIAGTRDRSLETLSALEREGDLVNIQTVDVKHRGRAWGLVLEHASGWKIAYSGDTMPCQALVEAGRNATLLIHEATLEDDKPEVAAAKGHSTFGQAIDIGIQMRAKFILLNHFSQRYPKLPTLQSRDDSEESSSPPIAMAFDLMTIPLSSFRTASTYTAALESLFSHDDGADSEAGDQDSVVILGTKSKKTQAASAKANSAEQTREEVAMNSGKDGTRNEKKARQERAKQVNAQNVNVRLSSSEVPPVVAAEVPANGRGRKRASGDRSPTTRDNRELEVKRTKQHADVDVPKSGGVLAA